MSALEILLLATNTGTLVLLGLSIRPTRLWIRAYKATSAPAHPTRTGTP
jgi:hypothetical protein